MSAQLASLLFAVLLALLPATARADHGLGHPNPHEVASDMISCLSDRFEISAARFQIDGFVFGGAEIANIQIDGQVQYHVARDVSPGNRGPIPPLGVASRNDDPALRLVYLFPEISPRAQVAFYAAALCFDRAVERFR